MGKNDVTAVSVILYFDSVTFSSCMQLCRICKFWGQKAKVLWIEHKGEPNITTGHDAKRHIHVLVVYNHGHLSIDKFQRDFMISGATIEEIHDWKEYIRYLLHRTPDSCNKIQYQLEEFHTNFDVTPYFNNLIDNHTPEGYAVMEIIEWGLKNDASFRQLGMHVINMGYPWSFFKSNSNYIMRSIEDERIRFNTKSIYEEKRLKL